MADNVDITPGTGATVAADEIAGVKHQRVKVQHGADGSATDVSAASPLPVVQTGTPGLPTGAATSAKQDSELALLGTIDADTGALAALISAGKLQVVQAFEDVITVSGSVDVGNTVSVNVLNTPIIDEIASALPAGDNNIGNVDVVTLPALVAGTANIGDVDVLTVPADPFGANADAASATGSISAKLRRAATDIAAMLAIFKAEDAGHTTADLGLPVWAVRSDAGGAVGNDGDYHPVLLDRRGAQRITFDYRPTFSFLIPSQVHVAGANTVHWDLFNADAAVLIRVQSILQIPNITTAVTGIVFDWLLERTTAVGTGGSALTAWLPDTSQTALDADVTCRSKPTGGATQSTDLRNYSLSSEETNAATIMVAALGGLELVPEELRRTGTGILLRQNQGLRCVQITNSAAGNTGWLITFTQET